MTRGAARLARLEAAVPRPVPQREYDLSRLTADQLERMAQLRERVDAVGLDGLSEDEFWELTELSEILLAPEPPGGGA